MTDLTKSRRAVALRIAEAMDTEWPNLNMEGFDIDEATDIIEPLIPMTAAEAEAEMEAMRDDSDDDEAICEPVVNPTLKSFKDAIGCGKVPIVEAIKTATELIQSLRAECASKEAELRITRQSFASCLLSVRKQNTDEWMYNAVGTLNDVCRALGTEYRFQFDGRDGIRKVK